MKKKSLFLKKLITGFFIVLLSVSMLNATNYYVDPATGNMGNPGTEASPWSTLAAVFSAGKTFASGDVIYLKNGNHGWPNITQSNSGVVTIKSYPGHNPIINRLDFNGASNWSIEGARIYTSSAPPATPVLEHPVYGIWDNYLVRLTNSSYVTLDNCYVYSIENSSSWTANDWNYKAWCGLKINTGSHHVTLKNSLFKNLNFAIDQSGTSNNTIRYNIVQNYCGDGLRVSTGSVIEYNEILDAYDTNGNHDDAMQAFASSNAIVRGNKVINTTSASRSFIAYGMQGLGFFDGFFDNYTVENNLLVLHTWHGIALYGARNCKIMNNTVIDNPMGSSSNGPPWIAVYNHKNGSASSGNVMRNNITSDIESTAGTTASNNIVTQSYTSHFVNYTALDMRLLSTSSAVNAGTTTGAPTIDLNQYPRTGNPDIGCYELGSVVSGGDTEAPSAPTNLSSGTVTYNSVALSWNASTDNVGVTGYKVYVNGTNPVSVGGTSATISGLSASTQYSFTVSAYDAAGNESAQSSSINATTQQAPSGITSDGTFQSFTLSTQTGEFTATFDATPNGNNIDALTGIQNGSASAYGDIACIIRFNSSGQFDARNGGSYAATNTINYSSGILYHFRVEVDVPAHTYSVFVTPDGGSEQTVASNFAFRSEQASVSQLTGWTIYAYIGSHTVDNMTFSTGSDTQAPSVPTGLATGTVTSNSVALSWNASTDNVGVTGYKVYTNGSNPVSVTGTSTTISGLSQATQYSFTVSAVDAVDNESAQSSAVQATTLDVQAPSVPTGLAAGTITGTSVALSWNASTDNVGVTGYKVYTDGSNPVSVTGTSPTISGLSQATQYGFTVSAVDAAGNESAQSSAVQATTLDAQAPSVPGGLASSAITQTSFTLSWSASTDNVGVSGYEVFKDGASIGTAASTSMSVSGLTAATTYSMTVRATDAAGNWSAPSTALQVTTATPPDTQAPSVPTGLTAGTITASSVDLSWNASTDNVGVTGYKVYTDGANPVSVTSTSATINSLNASTQYTFTVSAYDAVGNESAQSSALQVTTESVSTEVNLALGKTVTVSSEPQPENGAGNIVDDNTADNSRWSASGFPQWAVIDLGENCNLTSIEVFTYQSRAYRYIVEAMPAGGSYTTIIDRSLNTQSSPISDNVSVTARYVRITVSSAYGYTGSWVSLTEVKVMGTVGGGSDTQAPSAPTGLASSSVTATSFTLSWTASTDNVGVTGYDVYKNGVLATSVTGTSASITGLTSANTYSMTVKAKDAAGNVSAASSALNVTTLDNIAPSVPTGLTASTIAESSVTLCWNASVDNVGVTGYKVYTDGSNPVTVAGTCTTITGLAASTQYGFSVSAIDAAGNESAQSSTIYVPTTAPTGITSTSAWQSFDVSVQTGTFTAEFDVVPNAQDLDNVTGIQNGVGDFWSDLACIIRFNTSNTIDARNGSSYAASTSISYTAGTSYHLRLEINVPAHTYSIYVTPQGQSEITLGTNYAFRTEQQSVTQLTGWSLQALSGSHTVSGMTFTSGSSADITLANASEQSVKIYPNPLNSETLNVQLNGYETDAVNVAIYDLTGRSVFVQQYFNQTEIRIPADQLNSGIYIISVNGVQQKLIVE